MNTVIGAVLDIVAKALNLLHGGAEPTTGTVSTSQQEPLAKQNVGPDTTTLTQTQKVKSTKKQYDQENKLRRITTCHFCNEKIFASQRILAVELDNHQLKKFHQGCYMKYLDELERERFEALNKS